MIITRTQIEAARNSEDAMRTVISWWQWNDPNGEWEGALHYLDGHTDGCEDEDCEGCESCVKASDSWDVMSVADEICDRTIEYITVDCGDVLPD